MLPRSRGSAHDIAENGAGVAARGHHGASPAAPRHPPQRGSSSPSRQRVQRVCSVWAGVCDVCSSGHFLKAVLLQRLFQPTRALNAPPRQPAGTGRRRGEEARGTRAAARRCGGRVPLNCAPGFSFSWSFKQNRGRVMYVCFLEGAERGSKVKVHSQHFEK